MGEIKLIYCDGENSSKCYTELKAAYKSAQLKLQIKDQPIEEFVDFIEGRISDNVYVMYAPDTRLYRIGYTESVKKAHQRIINATGSNVELLFYVELEMGYDETSKALLNFIAKYFKDKKRSGLWFDLSQEELYAIFDLFVDSVFGWDVWHDGFNDHIKEIFNDSRLLQDV